MGHNQRRPQAIHERRFAIYLRDRPGYVRAQETHSRDDPRRSGIQHQRAGWIDGRIWANVYGYNNMLIVDPATGYVEAIVECDGLLEPEDIKRSTDVLNGIAYDPESKKIYVTGKRWPKMFEIELSR